jgi:hypothetical protein
MFFATVSNYPVEAEKNDTKEIDLQRLKGAKTLRITMGEGCQASWDDGKCTLKISKWDTSNKEYTFIIDSIQFMENGKFGKARLIGNISGVDVMTYLTGEGLTFIEEAPTGNMMILTVFASRNPGTDDYVCVYSRHINSLTTNSKLGPFPSQFQGVCKILN